MTRGEVYASCKFIACGGWVGERMSERKSFDYISDMKTLALIGVVLGHCLLFYAGNPYFPETADFTSKGAVWITTFTDASLISGFVFCSGFLFANSIKRRDRSIPEFLAGRSKRLIMTYYLYGALWLVPLYTFFNIKCFGRPDNAGYLTGYKYMLLGCFSDHLWFLWLLFWVSVIFILMKKMITKRFLPLLFLISVAAGLAVQLWLADFPYFKLSQTGPYFICYFLGILTFNYIDKAEKLPTPVLFILAAAFFAGSMFQHKAAETHFLLVWLCDICGIYTGFCFFMAVGRFKAFGRFRASRLWQYTREHSMQMYLFTCPFVYLYFRLIYPLIGDCTYACVAANFVMTMLTLYAAVWVQDKVKIKCKELTRKNAQE
ncbi:MAG: acyltransferase [Ruminococcus sp.]|nr:acyltransferase [Ruminococcus sp.]